MANYTHGKHFYFRYKTEQRSFVEAGFDYFCGGKKKRNFGETEPDQLCEVERNIFWTRWPPWHMWSPTFLVVEWILILLISVLQRCDPDPVTQFLLSFKPFYPFIVLFLLISETNFSSTSTRHLDIDYSLE